MIVGGVGDGAHEGERHAVLDTHLRDRGALHLDCERVGQCVAQRRDFVLARHETIAADHKPVAQLRTGEPEPFGERAALFLDELRARGLEPASQFGVGLEMGHAEQRHLVARKQRRCVEVVLQQRIRDDDVADPHPARDAARDACKDDPRHAEHMDQRADRRRGRDLADARERDDAGRAMHMADVIIAAAERDRFDCAFGAHRGDQVAEFLGQRRENAERLTGQGR